MLLLKIEIKKYHTVQTVAKSNQKIIFVNIDNIEYH
jgi:hypothetical protein